MTQSIAISPRPASVPETQFCGALQSHGRSLLVWPEALDDAVARQAVQAIVGFGARVLWLGRPADIDRLLPGAFRRTLPVHRRSRPQPELAEAPVGRLACRSAGTHARIVELQRSRGITPPPIHAFTEARHGAAEWDYWVIEQDGALAGVIQRQLLRRPVPGAGPDLALVCGLAVRPDFASLGYGRALLEHAAASAGTGSAICLSEPEHSTKYLIGQGWELTDATVELVGWR